MRRNLVILAAAIYMGAAAAPAHAHHSVSFFYDLCKSVTVEGRVEGVQWKDPHALVVLTLDNGTAYTIEWMHLRGLTNNLILRPAQAALVVGARVAVTGLPIRTLAEIRERFPDYTTAVNPNTIVPLLIRRADNSWSWAQKTFAKPLDCKGN